MNLSKMEDWVYEALRKNGLYLFKVKDLQLVLNKDRTKIYNIIKALKKKNAIKAVGKGFFTLKDTNEFLIAQGINYPSYISFWSALNYYGFSDQMPRKIFLATTKYSKEVSNFKYIKLSKERFFGYTSIGNITIADKEKAFVDSLLFPKYAGGIKEIIRSMKSALPEIRMKKIIDYALKVKSKAVIRRLGFILESLQYNRKLIKKLNRNIGKGYELLDPSLEKKWNLNKKWLLDINY